MFRMVRGSREHLTYRRLSHLERIYMYIFIFLFINISIIIIFQFSLFINMFLLLLSSVWSSGFTRLEYVRLILLLKFLIRFSFVCSCCSSRDHLIIFRVVSSNLWFWKLADDLCHVGIICLYFVCSFCSSRLLSLV